MQFMEMRMGLIFTLTCQSCAIDVSWKKIVKGNLGNHSGVVKITINLFLDHQLIF